MAEDHNGWDVWQRAVLGDLKELKESAKEQTELTTGLLIGMATLKKEFKIKSGIWGALGGAIPIIVTLVICILTGVL